MDELTLSDEQSRAFHRLTNAKYQYITRVIYGGAAGGGKSVLISIYLDYMCRTYPETRYYLGRDTLKDIKESILLTFFELTVITGADFKYREDKSKVTYKNGSEIFLLETFHYPADPNFDRFGSREYTAGAIEEGITTTKRAADILLSRTRYKHDVFDLFPKQLITCNPGPGWIKDDIVKPQMETGQAKRYNDIFVPATLQSNPNKKFADRYQQTLEENLSAFDRERLLGGNWDAQQKTGSEFLKSFSQDIHVKKQEYDFRSAIHLSFDENVHPYITCLIFQLDGKNARQLGEICMPPPNNTRKHVCNEFARRYPDHAAGLFVYGDATSMKNDTAKEYGENFFTDIVSYLAKYNPRLRVPSINPSVVGKGGFLNLIFEKNYRDISITIDPSCEKSIFDYAYALEDSDGTILKKKIQDPVTKISYEKHGHNLDALSYLICEAYMGDFNYYLTGGLNPSYEVGNDRSYKFNR